MDNEKLHESIMYLLGEIKAELKGVNQRLDTVNGRIGKHDTIIDQITKEQDELRGERKAHAKQSAWIASTISIIIAALGLVADKFK